MYPLLNNKVEETLHAFFGNVRLEIGAKDRFGNDATAKEWFLTCPKIVNQAVELVVNNDIYEVFFEKNSGKINFKRDRQYEE